ncbi:hypothetical protein MRX96_026932 [Rhipicephalus microplus]
MNGARDTPQHRPSAPVVAQMISSGDNDQSVRDVSLLGNSREVTLQEPQTRLSGVMSQAAPSDCPLSASDDALVCERLSDLRDTTLAEPSSGGATRTLWLPHESRPSRLARCTAQRRDIEHREPYSRRVANLILLRAQLQTDFLGIEAMEWAKSEWRIPRNDTPNSCMDIVIKESWDVYPVHAIRTTSEAFRLLSETKSIRKLRGTVVPVDWDDSRQPVEAKLLDFGTQKAMKQKRARLAKAAVATASSRTKEAPAETQREIGSDCCCDSAEKVKVLEDRVQDLEQRLQEARNNYDSLTMLKNLENWCVGWRIFQSSQRKLLSKPKRKAWF